MAGRVPRRAARRPTPHAAMALPIVIDDEVAAVLSSAARRRQTFSELELRHRRPARAQVAIALQNAELHARVADSAVRDPLTGLLNRRYFDEAVETAYANARRAGERAEPHRARPGPFLGGQQRVRPAAGDAVLRRVARAIAGAVRDGDIVARYGGEEFVVIAPDTDARARSSPPSGSGRRSPRRAGEPVDGRRRCRSRSRPASRQPGATSPTEEPSSGPPTRPSWPPSAPAATGSVSVWRRAPAPSRRAQSTTVRLCSRMNWAT